MEGRGRVWKNKRRKSLYNSECKDFGLIYRKLVDEAKILGIGKSPKESGTEELSEVDVINNSDDHGMTKETSEDASELPSFSNQLPLKPTNTCNTVSRSNKEYKQFIHDLKENVMPVDRESGQEQFDGIFDDLEKSNQTANLFYQAMEEPLFIVPPHLMGIEGIISAQEEKIELMQNECEKWKTMDRESVISDILQIDGSCDDDLPLYLSTNQKKMLDDITSYNVVNITDEFVDSLDEKLLNIERSLYEEVQAMNSQLEGRINTLVDHCESDVESPRTLLEQFNNTA